MSSVPTSTPFTLPGFDTTIGLTYDEAGPDRVVAHWTVHQHLLQPYGILHGGVHCSVVEGTASVGASLWFAQRFGDRGQVVGVANQTDFLRAVTDGTVLTATATPVHQGRSQQLWQVVVVDDQDRTVARGQVRLQNLPPREASEPTGTGG